VISLVPDGAPPAFQVPANPTGAICNLDCEYCLFLSKKELYPNSKFGMSTDTLERYIAQEIEAHRVPEVTVAWRGGEPTLMGLDFFKRAVELTEKHRRPDTTIYHTIQTQGCRLDHDWCEFFWQERFLVGLSLDGPREMHDVYRVDKGGWGTYDSVMAAARLLQWHGVHFKILTAVHAANVTGPLETYRFLRDEVGAEFIQFIPIVERVNSDGGPLLQEGSTVSERSVSAEQWGRFLIAVFDEWVRSDLGRINVQMFDAALASWTGELQSLCIFAESCGLALENNGDLCSCDHLAEPKHPPENFRQDRVLKLVASPEEQAFGLAKREALPKYCRECEVRFACNGECPKNRFIETPRGEPGLNYLCSGYKAFFNHIDRPMRIMTQLLRAGRAPRDVMAFITAEDEGSRP
jgi:uncharacterized protein